MKSDIRCTLEKYIGGDDCPILRQFARFKWLGVTDAHCKVYGLLEADVGPDPAKHCAYLVAVYEGQNSQRLLRLASDATRRLGEMASTNVRGIPLPGSF